MPAAFDTPTHVALLFTDAPATPSRTAIELAGWNVHAVAPPAEAAARLADAPGRGVAVLDLAAQPEAALHDIVAAMAHHAAAAGWPLVIVADTAQIDLVVDAAPAGTALLCEPAPGDWPLMLALATRDDPPARVREDERERLARLNAEIARIAALLADLTRETGQRAAERPLAYAPAVTAAEVAPSAADIRGVIRARRLRDRFFSEGLFADPAWDMLLDLFAAELEGGRVSVSSLCIAAAVPPTTALRWITTLTEAGLLARAPDPEDRRRAFLSLSADASQAMRRYAAATHEVGLHFV